MQTDKSGRNVEMKGCLGELVGIAGVIGVIVILCKTGHWEIVLGGGIGIGILIWLVSKAG